MPTTDPIADFLTRIRNAISSRKTRVDIPFSKMKFELAKILLDNNYIHDFVHVDEGHQGFLRLYLKFGSQGQSAIQGLRRISKPGLRKYVDHDHTPRVLNGLGISILTTSKGVMTGHQARKQSLGGEVLAEIW